jgi:hypothetical protein
MSITIEKLNEHDLVKNSWNGSIGRITAIYLANDEPYLNVHTGDRDYYHTIARNWKRLGGK